MSEIDINNQDWYQVNVSEEQNQRTRKRLQQLIDLGFKHYGVGSFGIEEVVSGIYIEKLWSFPEKYWVEYIDWIKTLIPRDKLIKLVYYKYFKKDDVDNNMHISINGYISAEKLKLIQQIGFLAEFDSNKYTARPTELRNLEHLID